MRRLLSLAAIACATLGAVTAISMAKLPPPLAKHQKLVCGAYGNACEVGGRHYNIATPVGDGPFPVVLYFHGSGRSGDKIMSSAGLVDRFIKRGYAFVAPTALNVQYSTGPGTGWLNNNRGKREGRDDFRFVQDVLDDIAERFDIDEQRVLVAGQSNGAIFSWYLACGDVDARLRHFAAHGGTPGVKYFSRCKDSTLDFSFLHAHGLADHVVPARGGFRENDNWEYHSPAKLVTGLADKANCRFERQAIVGPYQKTTHRECGTEQEYSVAFYEGGHGIPRHWPDFVLDWFEAFEPA